MKQENAKNWAGRTRNLVEGVINELIEAEREKIASSPGKTIADFENTSSGKEMVRALEEAGLFIEGIDLSGAASRKEAVLQVIENLETTWLLTARGRGLHYRKSAEMLTESMKQKLSEIENHGNLSLAQQENPEKTTEK